MNWAQFAAIVAKEGLAMAIEIWQTWKKHPDLNDEAIARLRELNKETLQDVIDATRP